MACLIYGTGQIYDIPSKHKIINIGGERAMKRNF